MFEPVHSSFKLKDLGDTFPLQRGKGYSSFTKNGMKYKKRNNPKFKLTLYPFENMFIIFILLRIYLQLFFSKPHFSSQSRNIILMLNVVINCIV